VCPTATRSRGLARPWAVSCRWRSSASSAHRGGSGRCVFRPSGRRLLPVCCPAMVVHTAGMSPQPIESSAAQPGPGNGDDQLWFRWSFHCQDLWIEDLDQEVSPGSVGFQVGITIVRRRTPTVGLPEGPAPRAGAVRGRRRQRARLPQLVNAVADVVVDPRPPVSLGFVCRALGEDTLCC
jgi:hypothetical protein